MTLSVETLAEAIMRAAGSSLRHYTVPATRKAILDATQTAYNAGREAGWRSFGELMTEQLGPAAPKIQHSEGE